MIITYSRFTINSKSFFSCALKKEIYLLPLAFHSLNHLKECFEKNNYELLYCKKINIKN